MCSCVCIALHEGHTSGTAYLLFWLPYPAILFQQLALLLRKMAEEPLQHQHLR